MELANFAASIWGFFLQSWIFLVSKWLSSPEGQEFLRRCYLEFGVYKDKVLPSDPQGRRSPQEENIRKEINLIYRFVKLNLKLDFFLIQYIKDCLDDKAFVNFKQYKGKAKNISAMNEVFDTRNNEVSLFHWHNYIDINLLDNIPMYNNFILHQYSFLNDIDFMKFMRFTVNVSERSSYNYLLNLNCSDRDEEESEVKSINNLALILWIRSWACPQLQGLGPSKRGTRFL